MSALTLFLRQQRLTCAALVVFLVFLITVSMLFLEDRNLMMTSMVSEDPDPAVLLNSQSQHRSLFEEGKSSIIQYVNHDTEPIIEHQYFNTDPIRSNPLNLAQCQNALIDHFEINKEGLLDTHLPHIHCEKRLRSNQRDRNINHSFIPYVWSREFLSALESESCFEPKTPVRSTNDLYSNDHYRTANNEVPVFYHIPKCGSSSTAAMTSDLFNFTIHWQDGPDRMHEPIRTRCGFAFIRDPMQRFISAYYTINKKIYREMEHQFISAEHKIPQRFKGKLSFLTVTGEPQRFKAFLDDLLKAPHVWGVEDPLKHVSSQSYFLSNWYGSDISFFGRVEHYGEHWKALMNEPECHWFRDLYKGNDAVDLEEYEVSHALFHYGTMGRSMYQSRDDRSKDYVDALGMREGLERMYGKDSKKWNISEDESLPPMYYLMTEELYDQIVDFYHQDYVCFGYKANYTQFREYVNSKKNPFQVD